MGITAPERESVRHLPICFSKELYTNCLVCCNKAHVPPICQVEIRSESKEKKKTITSGCFLHQWPSSPIPLRFVVSVTFFPTRPLCILVVPFNPQSEGWPNSPFNSSIPSNTISTTRQNPLFLSEVRATPGYAVLHTRGNHAYCPQKRKKKENRK